MRTFIEISLQASEERAGILIALLSDQNYYAFEQEEGVLKAFVLKEHFQENELDVVLEKNENYSAKEIMEENWNDEWERSFKPVTIDDFVNVRASFHSPNPVVEHDLVITPKMSFGTGHHATTCLMVRLMRAISFNDKKVLDFGTGTGILAILAEKLGSSGVTAIDNDEWSIENAIENCYANRCSKISVRKAHGLSGIISKDIILANINYRVLIDSVSDLARSCSPGADLVLSGFLISDLGTLSREYQNNGFTVIQSETSDDWAGAHLRF